MRFSLNLLFFLFGSVGIYSVCLIPFTEGKFIPFRKKADFWMWLSAAFMTIHYKPAARMSALQLSAAAPARIQKSGTCWSRKSKIHRLLGSKKQKSSASWRRITKNPALLGIEKPKIRHCLGSKNQKSGAVWGQKTQSPPLVGVEKAKSGAV